MNNQNNEMLIKCLTNIYDMMGQFNTVLDALMSVCVGSIKSIDQLNDSLELVLDNTKKLIDSSTEYSKFIENQIKIESEISDKELNKETYIKCIDLLNTSKNIMLKTNKSLEVIDLCIVYSAIVLDEDISKNNGRLIKKIEKLKAEKTTNQIFDELVLNIKNLILDLGNFSNEIMTSNLKK